MCVCVRARACVLKLRNYCSAPKPNTSSGSSNIPPSLTASRITSCLPSLPVRFSASRICFAVGFFTAGFSSVSSVAASRAPAATSHRFSVSSRESDCLHFCDSNSGRFPPEPRNDSIFETCSIDLQQTPNIAALRAPVALASARQRIPIILAVAVVSFLR